MPNATNFVWLVFLCHCTSLCGSGWDHIVLRCDRIYCSAKEEGREADVHRETVCYRPLNGRNIHAVSQAKQVSYQEDRTRLGEFKAMEFVGAILFLIAVPLFLFSLIPTLFLGEVCLRRRKDSTSLTGRDAASLFLFVVVMPLVMLILSTFMFEARYSSAKGEHWFYYINDGVAGLAIVPVYLVASVSVAWSLFKEDYRRTSWANIIMLGTLILISAWYTYASLFLQFTTIDDFYFEFLFIVPAIAFTNYTLLLCFIWQRRGRLSFNISFFISWIVALAGTIWVKMILARYIYESLPREPPPGYGDCFIVTAAARGHAGIVKSNVDAAGGKVSNLQLHRFRAFENALAGRWPACHRFLRRVYNRVGPPIARRIGNPYIADVVYCCLKPAEYAVVFLMLRVGK